MPQKQDYKILEENLKSVIQSLEKHNQYLDGFLFSFKDHKSVRYGLIKKDYQPRTLSGDALLLKKNTSFDKDGNFDLTKLSKPQIDENLNILELATEVLESLKCNYDELMIKDQSIRNVLTNTVPANKISFFISNYILKVATGLKIHVAGGYNKALNEAVKKVYESKENTTKASNNLIQNLEHIKDFLFKNIVFFSGKEEPANNRLRANQKMSLFFLYAHFVMPCLLFTNDVIKKATGTAEQKNIMQKAYDTVYKSYLDVAHNVFGNTEQIVEDNSVEFAKIIKDYFDKLDGLGVANKEPKVILASKLGYFKNISNIIQNNIISKNLKNKDNNGFKLNYTLPWQENFNAEYNFQQEKPTIIEDDQNIKDDLQKKGLLKNIGYQGNIANNIKNFAKKKRTKNNDDAKKLEEETDDNTFFGTGILRFKKNPKNFHYDEEEETKNKNKKQKTKKTDQSSNDEDVISGNKGLFIYNYNDYEVEEKKESFVQDENKDYKSINNNYIPNGIDISLPSQVVIENGPPNGGPGKGNNNLKKKADESNQGVNNEENKGNDALLKFSWSALTAGNVFFVLWLLSRKNVIKAGTKLTMSFCCLAVALGVVAVAGFIIYASSNNEKKNDNPSITNKNNDQQVSKN